MWGQCLKSLWLGSLPSVLLSPLIDANNRTVCKLPCDAEIGNQLKLASLIIAIKSIGEGQKQIRLVSTF